MDSLEDDVIETLEKIKQSKEDGDVSKELYDELVETLAEIAVKNGIDRLEFFEEVSRSMPFELDDQFNDEDVQGGSAPKSNKKSKEEKYWANLERVTKILRFINASYRFMKNVSACIGDNGDSD